MTTIRDATPEDFAPVLDLWRQDAEASATDDEAALRVVLDHPTARLLVAEDGGEVIGAMVAGFDGWRGEMYRLAVASAHRRSGIATGLVREAEAWLRDQGARRISVLVLSDADPAAAFWERAGYGLDARMRRHAAPGQC